MRSTSHNYLDRVRLLGAQTCLILSDSFHTSKQLKFHKTSEQEKSFHKKIFTYSCSTRLIY